MSQDPVDVPLRRRPQDVPPLRHKKPERQLITFAIVVIVASVVSSVIVSRHVERRLFFSRAALIGIAVELALLAFLQRARVAQAVKTFFTETSHPMNLAIFRMAVFWAIFHEVDITEIASFGSMSSGLQFAPWGMGWLLPHLPIHVRFAVALLVVFSIAGFLGVFSRTSALVCALAGFYALGIPQFYGKVDHNHHLLWFVAILAVSPCGDFLAVDAIVAAWKRANRGVTAPPPPSQAYALPLRFVMLLMGVIYFFPGFWKLWQSGFDWFLTNDLRSQLYLFWTWSFDTSWLPALRIDHHLFLCRIAAAITPLFELSFILFMFHRTLRAAAAFEGLIFHTLTNKFMRISFLSLRVCYVALFDWASIFGHIGRALAREEVFFVYDGTHSFSRGLVACIRSGDIFRRVTYIDSTDNETSRVLMRLPERNQRLRGQKAFVVRHNQIWTGFSAYRLLASRIPLLWPVLPLLYFGPPLDRALAACKLRSEGRRVSADDPKVAYSHHAQLACIAVVGTVLLLGSVCGGLSRHINGWPFACYPTFSSPAPTQIPFLRVVAVAPSGAEIAVREFGLSYHRYCGLARNILAIADPSVRDDRLLLVWARAVQTNPKLRTMTTVKFYVENSWIDPNLWSHNPSSRRLLFVWHPLEEGIIPRQPTKERFSDAEWQ